MIRMTARANKACKQIMTALVCTESLIFRVLHLALRPNVQCGCHLCRWERVSVLVIDM